MAEAQTATVYDAYITFDEEDKEDRLAGQLAIESGVLRVVSKANDDDGNYLDRLVEDYNGREFLVVKTAPTEEDAPRFTVGAKEYTRDNPEFVDVLRQKLHSSNGVRTEPAK
ncbi:MAG: hypothetical protein AAGJ46_08835 [Planctomycetota bacterium]